jgi:hypothetical protein
MRYCFNSHRLLIVFSGLALIAAPYEAGAHSYKLGSIAIGHLWTKPPKDGELNVFGPLFNMGNIPDRLISVTSTEADNIEIISTNVDGKKETFATIDLPPGKPVSLAEWREHIALKDLKIQPKEGDMVPLTFTFEKAGAINVEAAVESIQSSE